MPGLVHVVDDDASLRVAVERRLGQAGYEVTTYASAEEFLDRLPSEAAPSCILLDVRLLGMTGLELQSRLRELGSTLPIIFLTALADIALTVKAVKGGAHDFLTKPVSSEELLQSIERAMTYHQLTYDEEQVGHRSPSRRAVDATRGRSLAADYSRQNQQAGRHRAGLHGAHRESPSS